MKKLLILGQLSIIIFVATELCEELYEDMKIMTDEGMGFDKRDPASATVLLI